MSGQHGYTIRKIDVPSVTPLYGYLGLFGASIGYASVQSDYIGLGSSNVSYESVNMHENGNAVVDLISGIKYYACENDIELNDKVFLLGYSNGGYNSMAAHKILIDDPRDYDISASVLRVSASIMMTVCRVLVLRRAESTPHQHVSVLAQ